MYSHILLRYGELSTKGKNKMTFVRQLEKNIRKIVGVNPIVEYDRMFLPYSKENMNKLHFIFGIVSFSPVLEVSSNIETIKNALLKEIDANSASTFKVRTKRHWKEFPSTSMDISKNLGGFILANSNWKVDVKNPDVFVEVEIRKNNSYIFTKRMQGLGGYPVGVNGKVLHLISGGLDSPIAALEMMKRGIHVDFLNFITPPHTDERTIKKVDDIMNFLIKYQGRSKLYRSNYTDLMNLLGLTSNQSYKINLMRRSFYRIANDIAKIHNYLGISNGENLGQVASQTLESINTIQAVSSFPIYRPLLTADKIETINKSKAIGLYDLLITECVESCELFAPSKPIIKPNLGESVKLEEELKYVLKLEKENIENNIEISTFNLENS